MNLIRTYIRALSLLGPEGRLGWLLSAGNLGLAAAAFIEPVLFGRIIDTLAGSPQADGPPTRLAWLLAAWVGFGMFAIAAGVSVALFADRLPHRRARLGCARQHRAGAGLRPRRGRGHRPAQRGGQFARRADAGAVMVGRDRGAHARVDDAHAARDLSCRHLAALPGDASIGDIVM